MCGIVGALIFDAFERKSEERTRTEANIFITTQLLQATVERGKDATGVSLLWSDGNYTGLKMGIPAPDFIARFGETEKDFEGFLKIWREYPKLMKVFVGHCRKSSIGNSYDNKNNHPIQIGDIIMIHNGTLTNHEKIFDKLDCDRTGDVDSEAIGRLLHHYTNGGSEPFTADMLKEVTRRLNGTYSVLAMSGNNPYQVAQFRDGRPAEMVLVRPLKTVYVSSDKKFLENILFEYNKMSKLFARSAKFPYLKQADVEFKTLPDDSCAVWDLTVPVTFKTEIADLYDWQKTPLRVNKIWQSVTGGTSSTYDQSNNAYGQGVQKNTQGTEVDFLNKRNAKTGQGSVRDDDDDGLVWSRALNRYKTQTGIDETKEFGAVTVDVEKGEITNVKENAKGSGIKEVDKREVENLLVGTAEVKELSIERAKNAVESLANDDKKSSTGEGKSSGATIEVDMTSDPEALKRAGEYVDKGLIKYETDEEVAEDLNVSDASVLRPLSLYALANRIKKFIFKQGFITGYIYHKTEDKQPTSAKAENAEKKIRTMKLAVKVLATALEYRTRGNTPAAIEEMVETAIKDTFKTSKTARLDLGLAFSVGDMKNMPILKEIHAQTKEE